MGTRPGDACRWTAPIFALGGAMSLGLAFAAPDARQRALLLIFTAADVVVALFAWRAPWDRWPTRAGLSLAVLALPLCSMPAGLGVGPSSSYAAGFLAVFVWVGMTQPRRTSLWLLPPTAVAYVVPLLQRPNDRPTAWASSAIALPLFAFVSELVANVVAQLHDARADTERRADILAALAERDELTGLGNRRQAEAFLQALRPGDTVAMIDVDHFKRINDRDGHAVGDAVLARLGAYLRKAVRDVDLVARYGGDEFVVVFRQEAEPDAVVASHRLLDGWRSTVPSATLSIGVAHHRAGASAAETLRQADRALYRAKRAGRDVVSVVPAIASA